MNISRRELTLLRTALRVVLDDGYTETMTDFMIDEYKKLLHKLDDRIRLLEDNGND